MDKDLVVSSSDESWEVTEEENEVCSKVCYWCERRKCSRKKVGHVWRSCESCIREYAAEKWRATYDKTPDEGTTGDHSWSQSYAEGSTEGQSGTRMQGKGSLRKRGTASRGRAAMEGTIGQGTESGEERLSEIPEDTYEDQVSTNTNEEERIVRKRCGGVTKRAQPTNVKKLLTILCVAALVVQGDAAEEEAQEAPDYFSYLMFAGMLIGILAVYEFVKWVLKGLRDYCCTRAVVRGPELNRLTGERTTYAKFPSGQVRVVQDNYLQLSKPAQVLADREWKGRTELKMRVQRIAEGGM
eukprot:s1100_g9.t1